MLARVVHLHSAKKSYFVRRYCEIVGRAMAGHWGELWWVELFAGPGRLLEHETGRFLPGSPIEALTIPRRFSGYVFADIVIAGGESGHGHRPVQLDWLRYIRDLCVAKHVPLFFKQWGGRTPKAGGRELDGREWSQMPAGLRFVA